MDNNMIKEIIAKRVAKELNDGDVVNLGIGVPTLVANYIPEEVEVTLQSENGFLGLGSAPLPGEENVDLTNAGGKYVTIKEGGAFFDSAMSFIIIRGGHVDATVLGALQVDQHGNLANWMIPGKLVPGMGGAMDLVTGAKRVIVAMEHTDKNGNPKILKKCSLPLTGKNVVDLIITEKALIEVTAEGLLLREIGPSTTVDEVMKCTEADLFVSDNIKVF